MQPAAVATRATGLHVVQVVCGLPDQESCRRAHVADLGRLNPAGPECRGLNVQAGAAGGMWVAWPCGLLQSALVVAGLASTPAGGAAVMAAFALSSSMGLQVAPTLWRWWQARSAGRATELQRGVVRLSGGMLALGSAWALGHGAWSQIRAYCLG